MPVADSLTQAEANVCSDDGCNDTPAADICSEDSSNDAATQTAAASASYLVIFAMLTMLV